MNYAKRQKVNNKLGKINSKAKYKSQSAIQKGRGKMDNLNAKAQQAKARGNTERETNLQRRMSNTKTKITTKLSNIKSRAATKSAQVQKRAKGTKGKSCK